MACCGRIWTRRASSGTPPGGCWPGWSTSTARRGVVFDGAGLRGQTAAGDLGRGRPERGGGVCAAASTSPARRPRSTSPICGSFWRGVKTKVFLFTLRLSYSGRAAHRVFATQAQEAFLEGHVHAFDVVGWGAGRHDPLRQPQSGGVSRVLFGRNRIESRALGDVPLALRLRRVLLPARDRRGAREGRSGGRRRPVPPQPSRADARGRFHRAAERASGARRRPRRRTGGSSTGPTRSGRTSPSRRRCCRRCRRSRSRPA